ncbi:unnamed protein product [Cunninghamella echinulata]
MGNTLSEPQLTIRKIHRKQLYEKKRQQEEEHRLKSPLHRHHPMKQTYFNSWCPTNLPGLYNNNNNLLPYFPVSDFNHIPHLPFYYHQPTSMYMDHRLIQPSWNHYQQPIYTMYPLH